MLTDITGITQKQMKVGSGGIPQTGEMHQFRYNTKADQGRYWRLAGEMLTDIELSMT